MSVVQSTKQRRTPEGSKLKERRWENLKFRMVIISFEKGYEKPEECTKYGRFLG
jgi:hypothetical protein